MKEAVWTGARTAGARTKAIEKSGVAEAVSAAPRFPSVFRYRSVLDCLTASLSCNLCQVYYTADCAPIDDGATEWEVFVAGRPVGHTRGPA